MKTRPLLSVVIPTWNRVRLVCEAIDSVLGQKNGEVEVIVIDDGATDDTAEVVERRFGSSIKLLRMPRQGGVAAARNAGVRLANGELLAFLDSDDLWLPGKLDAELAVLERFPDADAVVSDSLWFIEGHPNDRSRFEQNGLLAATQGRVRWMSECLWSWMIPQNGLAICSITLRRRSLTRLGEPLFAKDLTSCEDWELQVRVYQECRVIVLPKVWSYIRYIDDGTRQGRACAGKCPNREQQMTLLRDRLTATGRSVKVAGLAPDLSAELERYRFDSAQQLAQLEGIEE